MDLSKFDTMDLQESGVECEILGPDGTEKLDIFIKLKGIDSQARQAGLFKRARMESATQSPSGDDDPEVASQKYTDRLIDDLVSMTVSWRGVVLDGKELECTPENCEMIYRRFPFIRDQAKAFVEHRANFFTK